MPIYLIRHTAPEKNGGLCYGQSDLPVARSFTQEAEAIRTVLPAKFQSVYSSPLQRCSILAKELFPSVEPKIKPQLQELDFGMWEMRYWSDIPRKELDAWAIDYVDTAPPLGESFRELYQRCVSVWETSLVREFAGNTAVVTHAGVIRALLVHLLHIPLKNAFSLELQYGAVIRLQKVGNKDYTVAFLKH